LTGQQELVESSSSMGAWSALARDAPLVELPLEIAVQVARPLHVCEVVMQVQRQVGEAALDLNLALITRCGDGRHGAILGIWCQLVGM
jgi:hypothetical protein